MDYFWTSRAGWLSIIYIYIYMRLNLMQSRHKSRGLLSWSLPETNSSPLKIRHAKRKFYQPLIFRGYACFRECNFQGCIWKRYKPMAKRNNTSDSLSSLGEDDILIRHLLR